MATISFSQAINLIEERNQIFNLVINKEGNEAASVRVSTTGASTGTAHKYQDRAIKSTKGDFYSTNTTLNWEEDDTSSRVVPIRIYGDTEENEGEEYFYATITTKEENTKVGLYRCHNFILEDPANFFSRYITGDYGIEMGGEKIPVTKTGAFELQYVDTNTMDFLPEQLMGGNVFVGAENTFTWKRISSNMVFVSGELNANLTAPLASDIAAYNQSENTQISSYLLFAAKVPITNMTDQVIPLTLANVHSSDFARINSEAQQAEANATMRTFMAPKSNLIYFECKRDNFTSNLTVKAGLEETVANIKFSISGVVPTPIK